ncbi:MAG: STAS-like domain-containing protein [Bacteroides sp.]|nr:STAS-like domain-containing protein [Bacteroides sp.]
METQKVINCNIIDFSQSPGPRYCTQGDDSGEKFYHEVLNNKFAEAYKTDSKLIVSLDGTDGYASSFLDEAFGNLVYDFSATEVNKRLEIISLDEDIWIEMIKNETIPEWEKRRELNQPAKLTDEHEAWFRLVNGELQEANWE